MKKALIYIIFVRMVLLALPAHAQQKEYKGTLNITPLRLEQKGDSLYIEIDFDVTEVRVPSRRSVTIVPVLTAPGVEKQLAGVELKGRGNFLASKREFTLMSKARRAWYEQHKPYVIIKGYKSDDNKQLRYSKTLLFQPWMKEARLDIREDLCGCGNPVRSLGVFELLSHVELEPGIEPYRVTPFLCYRRPEVEAMKRRETKEEVKLNFAVNKTNLMPDYMNNAQELAALSQTLKAVQSDASVTVQGIHIVGYASPEGSDEGNRKLSEGRALTLVNYLLSNFDYPRSLYTVEYGGENWSGLIEKVEASDMKYRNEVLEIIQNVPQAIDYKKKSSRKKSLMLLHHGEPYLYMLHEFYPSLRKAVYIIDYVVKGFELDEAREVFKTNPKNLSLNEMYLLANSYKNDTTALSEVFETAARLFPQDEIANLNAAVAALSRNDVVTAERYLKKVTTPSAEYENALGVLSLQKEDYTQAEKHLKQAAEMGLKEAEKNLEELKKKQDNLRLIRKQNHTN